MQVGKLALGHLAVATDKHGVGKLNAMKTHLGLTSFRACARSSIGGCSTDAHSRGVLPAGAVHR